MSKAPNPLKMISVVKIGGNVIDDPGALKAFLREFAAIEGPKILVHGGGKLATRLAERLELKVQMVDGRRITDKGMLDVVTMVYAGLVNKQIVAGLQAFGCNAIGLSGADANVVTARRRDPHPIDYGFVGDIERVDAERLGRWLAEGLVPVFSAIMHDGRGALLNCNADSVASSVALGVAPLAPTDLIFCFEKAGVLRDPDDETSVIGQITAESFLSLKAEGIVSKGMIPKIENALRAVENGVRSVTIRHSKALENGIGTVIRRDGPEGRKPAAAKRAPSEGASDTAEAEAKAAEVKASKPSKASKRSEASGTSEPSKISKTPEASEASEARVRRAPRNDKAKR